jgi:hypothetical protein
VLACRRHKSDWRDMKPRKGVLMAFVAVAGVVASLAVLVPGTEAAQPVIGVGMPFAGKFSSGITDPAFHRVYSAKFNWSTDIFAESTPVYVRLIGLPPDGTVTALTNTPKKGECGNRVVVTVAAGGRELGRIYYEHLMTPIASGRVNLSQPIGRTAKYDGEVVEKDLPKAKDEKHLWPQGCYDVNRPEGVHTHMEVRGFNDNNRACYEPIAVGTRLADATQIGRIGDTNIKNDQMACKPKTPDPVPAPTTTSTTTSTTSTTTTSTTTTTIPDD